MKKILIIRLSSFGDIVQCLPAATTLHNNYPKAEIHWLTKKEFINVLDLCSEIDKKMSFDRKTGVIGLIKLALELRKENYDLIYDAHKNIRTFLLKIILFSFSIKFITRSKFRLKRFLLFYLRINLFPKPFRGIKSFIAPLQNDLDLSMTTSSIDNENLINKKLDATYICLAPSAAWEMKRWPINYWKELAQKLVESYPTKKIYILGGPNDTFCEGLAIHRNIENLAGKLSLFESCIYVKNSQLLICADTGLIHVADIFGVNGISILGPTAFGFPTNSNIIEAQVDLKCRPCTKDGRGICSQKTYKKCLLDIKPHTILNLAQRTLS